MPSDRLVSQPEISPIGQFESALLKLSSTSVDSANFEPITPEAINIDETRTALKNAGFTLEIGAEERASLGKRQFRDLERGRGPGVVAVLGQEKAEALLPWALKESIDGPRIISNKTGKPIEGSQGRGVQQLAADILLLAVKGENARGEDIQAFCEKLNRRVWKGARWKKSHHEKAAIDAIFRGYRIPEPSKKLTSVLPSILPDLWSWLCS